MQDMHLLLSVVPGVFAEIAPAGHFCAHKPQEVQLESAFGTIPVPAFLYGLLPGTEGLDNLLEVAFSRIRLPNYARSLQSSKLGLPAAYSCMMECSATAEMAAITWNPAFWA